MVLITRWRQGGELINLTKADRTATSRINDRNNFPLLVFFSTTTLLLSSPLGIELDWKTERC